MSVHSTSSMTTTEVPHQKLRTFSPVILFHDHEYVKAGSGDLEHVHIPYSDPRHLDLHKKRIHEMLQTNGRYWLDIITWSRDHPESLDHSPVPSLVSSPSPPHYHYMNSHQGYHHSHPTTTNSSNTSSPSTARKPALDKKTPSSVTATNNNNKRRRGNLPKAVTAILRDWLSRHKKHPYPTEEEKAALAAETNLNLNQISNWFINARRRILQPMLEQEDSNSSDHRKTELDIISSMPYAYHPHPYSHASNNDLDDYALDNRRLRKRSASEVQLAPTKYPPQKRMTPNNRRR